MNIDIQEYLQMANKLISIPTGFEPVLAREVQQDGERAIWIRLKKSNAYNHQWGGEHFSLTFTPDDKKLKGFIHLEEQFETDSIPTEEEAEKIAFDFLKIHASDLLDTVEIRWIRPLRKKPISPPHDEGFVLNTGTIITGMRVKLFINSNGKYAWVISGKDGQVITFERDIVWDTTKKCRATERWLHDVWAKQQVTLEEIKR